MTNDISECKCGCVSPIFFRPDIFCFTLKTGPADFLFLFVFTWERDVMLRHTLERLDAALHEPGPASARSEAVDKGLHVLLSRACCVRGARRLQQPPCASLFRLY
jgi:hypothetical protein